VGLISFILPVDYAAAVALEVRQPSSGGAPVLRFNFKNGSSSGFQAYDLLGGSGDIPLSTFVNALAVSARAFFTGVFYPNDNHLQQPVAVNTTADWCNVCANTQDRGCGAIAAAAASARAQYREHHPISPVGAGFLGAGVTLACVAATLAMLAFMGLLTLGKQRKWADRKTVS
jgi:hypothetical protein